LCDMRTLLLETEERMRSGSVIAMYYRTSKQQPGLNKVGNLHGEVHVVAVARQKRACAEINTNISPFQPSPYICKTYKDIVLECTTLWGEPDRVHVQNMEQLNAYEFMSSECDSTSVHRIQKYTHANKL